MPIFSRAIFNHKYEDDHETPCRFSFAGRLIQGTYSGPTVTPDTVENQLFTVHKISADTIHIAGFGESGFDMYYLNDTDTTDAAVVFSGSGSSLSYSFTATFWVSRDSLHLEAQQHITTGTGNFWRFDGKKQ